MKTGLAAIFLCVSLSNALTFDNAKKDILPGKEECGVEKGTAEGKFPWVAFLPLATRTFNPQANVRCAGVLISKRYVAVAKSCLGFVVGKVYLGQYDTTRKETCEKSQCKPVLELDVEERVVSDDHDVVLLRLSKDVGFTDFIRPICLPFENLKRAAVGDAVYSSGWGLKTPTSNEVVTIKKHVEETLVDVEECKKAKNLFTVEAPRVLCLKVKEGSKDKPCNGEEGSPVMFYSSDRWILEGILQHVFGSIDVPCVTEGVARGEKITDAVLQWIVEKIH